MTSFALAFGVFSATARTVSINGTISYTATSALVQIAASIDNAFAVDDNGNLIDIENTRNLTVKNFDSNYDMLSAFSYVSGASARLLAGDRWDIGSIKFNPSPNVVPSNQTPQGNEISATIVIAFEIYNYSFYPIKVNVTSNPTSSLAQWTEGSNSIGYDFSDATVANINGADSTRTTIDHKTSYIYLKLNNLSADINEAINFSFKVTITPVAS